MAGMKGLGRAGKAPENDARSIRDYLEQFAAIPFLDGQMVDAKFVAGAFFVQVPHSLGRVVQGGWQVNADGFFLCTVLVPFQNADPTRYTYLVSQTPAGADVNVKVWIY